MPLLDLFWAPFWFALFFAIIGVYVWGAVAIWRLTGRAQFDRTSRVIVRVLSLTVYPSPSPLPHARIRGLERHVKGDGWG